MNKHFTEFVKDILPREDLKSLINEFMVDASVNMGNDFTDATLERTIEIIENNFKFLPIYAVARAFKKGSLGHYGTGRLVPRVIYGWLNEETVEYNREITHDNLKDSLSIAHFKDLENYPLGKSICWKIDHIGIDDWDKIPLRSIAEIIGRGQIPTLEMFNIKSKNDKENISSL